MAFSSKEFPLNLIQEGEAISRKMLRYMEKVPFTTVIFCEKVNENKSASSIKATKKAFSLSGKALVTDMRGKWYEISFFLHKKLA